MDENDGAASTTKSKSRSASITFGVLSLLVLVIGYWQGTANGLAGGFTFLLVGLPLGMVLGITALVLLAISRGSSKPKTIELPANYKQKTKTKLIVFACLSLASWLYVFASLSSTEVIGNFYFQIGLSYLVVEALTYSAFIGTALFPILTIFYATRLRAIAIK